MTLGINNAARFRYLADGENRPFVFPILITASASLAGKIALGGHRLRLLDNWNIWKIGDGGDEQGIDIDFESLELVGSDIQKFYIDAGTDDPIDIKANKATLRLDAADEPSEVLSVSLRSASGPAADIVIRLAESLDVWLDANSERVWFPC